MRSVLAAALAGTLAIGCSEAPVGRAVEADATTRVYVAAGVRTMDPARPQATAVAVADGRVVAVGDLDSVRERIGDDFELDRRFADLILMPGFIEPHLHPYLAGVLLPMEFITPHDWSLPGRQVAGVRGRDGYLVRLAAHEASLADGEWLWTWGFHHYFHGRLSRADLDAISAERPMVVWHRSFHEVILNSAAIAALEFDDSVDEHPNVNLADGHFYETGLGAAIAKLSPYLFDPERYGRALDEAREIIHRGGITTVSDGAFGLVDLELELGFLERGGWGGDETPFRMILMPDGRVEGSTAPEASLALIETLPARSTDRLRFPKSVKLFADGAAYSQLMRLRDGYLDGHHGEWLMTPEELEEAARVFWNAGYQIHVHVNGDLGLEKVLDVLEKLQTENPRDDHRFTLHHFMIAGLDQIPRIAELGAMVSANPFYIWALADKYAEVGLGPERAALTVPAGSVVEAGIPLSFHSDFTMAPAQPLVLAWAAASRLTADGNRPGPEQRISVQEAMEAITTDAAFQLRMEDEIGSIEVGKRADFTVLDTDPFEVPVDELRNIQIWGTVYEGRPYPVD
ncbi:MAG: amidohydrolase [Acidobacteriota bacterium]|nr:amidohydrolase [Acidobacteriota bacterium]